MATFTYNAIFKKTSTFVAAAIFTAFFLERGIEVATEKVWDSGNQGVSLLL